MTSPEAPLSAELRRLPLAERRDHLHEAVHSEFRTALFLSDTEPVPEDENYFALGVTSLGLMDIKSRLDERLGVSISSTALFNHPTVEELIDYLVGEVLADLFTARESTHSAPADRQGG
ncbi:acyl carrier protein [Streptomyces sp. 4N509B]|uniref:acyl carrier protein n=1 Tax=Streptomyces sp. 4N509B TaxID=3457413 RepID=UPI003FD6AB76